MPKDPKEAVECPVCDRIFKSRDTRTRHMKKEHNHLKLCLKCPGGLQHCLLPNCRRKNGHCHDPSHDEERPGPPDDNTRRAFQNSRLPNASIPEVGPCEVCPSRQRCVVLGCRTRSHCHNPEHRFAQSVFAARKAFLLDCWDARVYAQLTAAQTSQRQQPGDLGPNARNHAQQPDAGTRAPDGHWQREHAATVEGHHAYLQQELDFSLSREMSAGGLVQDNEAT